MPINPVLLATAIATLADLDPEADLAGTLERAVVSAKQLFQVDAAGIMLGDGDGRLRWASASDPLAQTLENNQEACAAGPCMQAFTSGRPAVMHDTTLEQRWEQLVPAFAELQVRSALSVPIELGGGPIGSLDVYAVAPGGWDQTEVSALQAYAGLVATLLGTAAKAERSGWLAEQLQVALEARALVEQVKGAVMERGGLDGQQAFIDLRRAARSFRDPPTDGADETVPGLPQGSRPATPAVAADTQTPRVDVGALDAEANALLEREPDADLGIGHKLSLVLLGFFATEVVPLADKLAGLGVDPRPILTATTGMLRLYADTLEQHDPRR